MFLNKNFVSIMRYSGVFDSVYRRGDTERNAQETGIRTASEVDEENISKIIV